MGPVRKERYWTKLSTEVWITQKGPRFIFYKFYKFTYIWNTNNISKKHWRARSERTQASPRWAGPDPAWGEHGMTGFKPDRQAKAVSRRGYQISMRRTRPFDLVRIDGPHSSSPLERVRAAETLGFAGRTWGSPRALLDVGERRRSLRGLCVDKAWHRQWMRQLLATTWSRRLPWVLRLSSTMPMFFGRPSQNGGHG
jgi:hypothetical protein